MYTMLIVYILYFMEGYEKNYSFKDAFTGKILMEELFWNINIYEKDEYL